MLARVIEFANACARWDGSERGSGPLVARLFHRILALIFLVAWISLGSQVHTLIGSRGLLPIARFVAESGVQSESFWKYPSFLIGHPGDRAITTGVVLGMCLSLAGLLGALPRGALVFNYALYLGYAIACRAFLGFQWDNLLLEAGALAVFLPRDHRARVMHLLFRLLLFKLYFESGIAKWQSDLHDWRDGSAMTFYFETAPIPTRLGWYAHQLPRSVHHVESWATLVLELILPFGIFAKRRVRLATAATFTGFQVINAATANYGFFCYLATALHVFLLDDGDVARVADRARAVIPPWLRAWRSKLPRVDPGAVVSRVLGDRPHARALAGVAVLALWSAASLEDGLRTFVQSERWQARLDSLDRYYALIEPWRVANTYHLFGRITRERIEPEFQTSDGSAWTAHALWYKPGPVDRPPPFVAPHQPRVDFLLWFYGLSFQHGFPEYVLAIARGLCHDPDAVQPLFVQPVSARAAAIRIAFWQYHYTNPQERARSGAYWTREWLGSTRAWSCR